MAPMALLIGWQWGVTIFMLVLFFSIGSGIFYAVWSISHKRRPPATEFEPHSQVRRGSDEPEVG
jgi:hypothetical protein